MSQTPKNSSYTPVSENFADFLPKSWLWWVDEALTSYVKTHYSPQKSWANKPFNLVDAQFYFKSIRELSELFTTARQSKFPDYFSQAKFRSAYLLYFFALQASKFLYLFKKHDNALAELFEQKTLSLYDLGCGPATASLALLMKLQESHRVPEQIQIYLNDQSAPILKDAERLIQTYSDQFSQLRGKIQIKTFKGFWWKTPSLFDSVNTETSKLVLMGHVLNESIPHPRAETQILESLKKTLQTSSPKSATQLFMVEPAHKEISQFLSTLKDQTLEHASVVGPCLHAGLCPLSTGKDWCHFSQPIELKGKWLSDFSRRLESPKTWLKLSYLWLSSNPVNTSSHKSVRLVVSDPLRSSQGHSEVQLCEPESIRRLKLKKNDRLFRGQKIKLN